MEFSDVSYKPIIDKMTWSYSRIEAYENCPYKWFMSYILRAKQEQQFYASYGSFMHELLEEYYKNKKTKTELSSIFLSEFSNKVIGNRPKEDTLKKYIAEGISCIENLSKFDFEIISVEEKIDFYINNIPFTCKIDIIGKDKDGYIIIDHKSRALKNRSKKNRKTANDKEIDKMLRQLYIYSEAVKYKYGEFPTRLCFNCFRNQIFIEEMFSEDLYNDTTKWVENRVKAISNAIDFFPRLEYFHCNYLCGYGDDCCYK